MATRCADPDDAADVVAETFLTAWRRLADVPLGADGRLWLFGTARRVLANHDRSARRQSSAAIGQLEPIWAFPLFFLSKGSGVAICDAVRTRTADQSSSVAKSSRKGE